jgi:hypothetical protein
VKGSPLERLAHYAQPVRGCWVWTGATDGYGYGLMRFHGKVIRSHRVAYLVHRGPIPAGLVVRHDCDNPPCVNPSHLRLGTRVDNNRDRDKRGRHVPQIGEEHPLAILTEADVLTIRASRLDRRKLADLFGVSLWTVDDVRTRRSWKHI